jgi:hypothetical protein
MTWNSANFFCNFGIKKNSFQKLRLLAQNWNLQLFTKNPELCNFYKKVYGLIGAQCLKAEKTLSLRLLLYRRVNCGLIFEDHKVAKFLGS